MKCIVDASFLVWAVVDAPSEAGDRSLELQQRLQQDSELEAPWLLSYEVGNSLSQARLAIPAERRATLHGLLLSGITLVGPGQADVEAIHRLARDHGLTFYDAAYLQLAERDSGTLFTEDQRLLEAARRLLGPDRVYDIESAHARFVRKGAAT